MFQVAVDSLVPFSSTGNTQVWKKNKTKLISWKFVKTTSLIFTALLSNCHLKLKTETNAAEPERRAPTVDSLVSLVSTQTSAVQKAL